MLFNVERRWLDEVEARCNAATPGPWDEDNPGGGENDKVIGFNGAIAHDICSPADTAFIASARMDVPRLVALVRRIAATPTSAQLLAENHTLRLQLEANRKRGDAAVNDVNQLLRIKRWADRCIFCDQCTIHGYECDDCDVDAVWRGECPENTKEEK